MIRIVTFALALLFLVGDPLAAIELTSPSAKGSDAELAEVVATLEEGYHLLKDLQADFRQKTSVAALKREEKGNGELFIKRPASAAAMFRFDYKKPRQQIVCDGKQVWFYIPENSQVMISDVKAILAQGGVALNYLTGMGTVSRDFAISFPGSRRDAKGNYLLELIPKKGGQAFAKLQLTISGMAVDTYRESGKASEPFPIVSSVIIDQMGNRTSIEYAKVRTNQGISSERFRFKVPSGVEIIKP